MTTAPGDRNAQLPDRALGACSRPLADERRSNLSDGDGRVGAERLPGFIQALGAVYTAPERGSALGLPAGRPPGVGPPSAAMGVSWPFHASALTGDALTSISARLGRAATCTQLRAGGLPSK